MDLSEYRCTFFDRTSDTRTCDAIVRQVDLREHLASHGIAEPTVGQVLETFVLHRAAFGRPKAPVAKVEDKTEPMFSREDFR